MDTQKNAAVADLVVRDDNGFMARYVVDALAEHLDLVARMTERKARIFVLEPPNIHTEGIDVDAEIERAISAVDIGTTERPVFIVQIELHYLKHRIFRGERIPLRVHVERGLFLGIIGIGEGGAMFFDPTFASAGSTAAVERLRVFVG